MVKSACLGRASATVGERRSLSARARDSSPSRAAPT